MGFYDELDADQHFTPVESEAPGPLERLVPSRLESIDAGAPTAPGQVSPDNGEGGSLSPDQGPPGTEEPLPLALDEADDAERRAIALDPGLTPAQDQARLVRQIDGAVLRRLLDELRRAEEAHKLATRAKAFEPDELSAKLLELATPEARRLGVPPEALAEQVRLLYEGFYGFEDYFDNHRISDIMINRYDEVYVEEDGVMHRVKSPFYNPVEVDNFIDRMVGKFGVDKPTLDSPIADWNFPYHTPDGYDLNFRANIVLGTKTSSGQTVISIRKPAAEGKYDKLNAWCTPTESDPEPAMSPQAARFLREVSAHRATILIAGPTGSGKTSLMRALLEEMRPDLRVISVEEAQELVFKRPNTYGLLANKTLKLSELITSAMRQRPDILLVGECRAPDEAVAFLTAANTGHDGSITTTHSSGAEAGLYRLLNLTNEASGKASSTYVGNQVREAIDLVVYIAVYDDEQAAGRPRRIRRVMEILTIADFDAPDDRPRFTTRPVFGRYTDQQLGINRHTAIHAPLRCQGFGGLSDSFVAKMERNGLSEERLRELFDEAKPDLDQDQEGAKMADSSSFGRTTRR